MNSHMVLHSPKAHSNQQLNPDLPHGRLEPRDASHHCRLPGCSAAAELGIEPRPLQGGNMRIWTDRKTAAPVSCALELEFPLLVLTATSPDKIKS